MTATRDPLAAGAGSERDQLELERHRSELTGYCYRMLGSASEAEDAVQDTFLRAWRGRGGFQGRSSLRSWLYKIATNVCLDMLQGAKRRARPMDMGPASNVESILDGGIAQELWILPVPDARVMSPSGDPAELAARRETIRLAFVAALQHLPPRQRAVLILREVLHWQASEVAELLGSSTASVNSALQRARATLDAVQPEPGDPTPQDERDRELVARYMDAFQRYDIASLVTLLHEDATFSMPPHRLWLRGPSEVHRWMLGPGIGCRGSRLLATAANGCAAFGSYKLSAAGGREPFSVQVLELSGGRIAAIHNFLYPELFPVFGLPTRLDG
ncbi:MAG: sigma-70 family RNA polymerase sigma factor [Solirubrobacterales bacterium]|nr:sigma-70 family RNA polymerase sigma factor [Solirubrobacterales bacterium]